jgi:ABC-type branched-subunit amino acid transport system substrate-binding protein
MKEGLDFAMEYWNNNLIKQKKLFIKIEDSKSNPKDGITSLNFLISQNYKFFIIPHSIMAINAKPIIVNNPNTLAFLDASHPDIVTPPNPRIFRHSQNAEWEAENILKYIISSGNDIKKIALFYINDEYGQSFAKRVEYLLNLNETREIQLSLIPYEVNTLDFKNLVLKSEINKDKGSVAIIVGVGKPMGLLIKKIRELGYKGDIFAAMGYIATGVRDLLSSVERENIYYTDLYWDDNPWLEWLEKKYFSLNKRDIPGVTKLEFLSALLLAYAINESNSKDVNLVAQKIRELSPKLIGINVTENGELNPKIIIKRDSYKK